ncbi:MAG: hypothetical protein KKA99_06235 [Gammaproteobacteria bacterium]|nr:hypothetical protein [Gammaproteobacteria bacterium]
MYGKKTLARVSLREMGYNEPQLEPILKDHCNLFLGLGLYSEKHGLSAGVPFDLVHFLLFAKRARKLISEQHPKSSLTIIIGDAQAELSCPEEKAAIQALAKHYQEVLQILMEALQMQVNTQIVFALAIEATAEYSEIVNDLEQRFKTAQDLKIQSLLQDSAHFPYYFSQTATVRYMHLYQGVGYKISWLKERSKKTIEKKSLFSDTAVGDELSFDVLYRTLYGDRLGFLYTKSGFHRVERKGYKEAQEVPPYIAYPNADGKTFVRYVFGQAAPLELRSEFKRIGKGKGKMTKYMVGFRRILSKEVGKEADEFFETVNERVNKTSPRFVIPAKARI